MTTDIPLFQLDGPGDTSISLTLEHRSNQASGGPPDLGKGIPGRGWSHNLTSSVQLNADLTQSIGLSTVTAWEVFFNNNVLTSAKRRPGVRSDVVSINSGSTLTGYIVTDQGSKSKWYYQQPGDSAHKQFFLSKIVDAFGNQVTWAYDADGRVKSVTDASGVRKVEFTYKGSVAISLVDYVELITPDGTRRWTLNHGVASNSTAGVLTGFLRSVDFPKIWSTGSTPSVAIEYTNYGSVEDLYDFQGHRWHYEYAPVDPGNAPGLGLYRAYVPLITAPIDEPSGLYYNGNWTEFNWSIPNPAVGAYNVCTIKDILDKEWVHKYLTVVPVGTPYASDLQYMPHPIYQTIDPTVLSNNVNQTFSDTYTWNFNDGTLKRYVDRRGNATDFTYDSNLRGLMLSKTEWLTGTTSQTWNYAYASDRIRRQTDPSGNRIVYEYDPTTFALTSVTKDPTTDPTDGSFSNPTGKSITTHYTYTSSGAKGELASTYVGSDAPTTYANFDAYGHAQKTTNPMGVESYASFDAWNNQLTSVEAFPKGTTTYSYDGWDRRYKTIHPVVNGSDPNEPVTSYTLYDGMGRLYKTIDENGVITLYEHDGIGRLRFVRQPVDATTTLVTEYGYNDRGDRVSMRSPRGYQTSGIYTTTYTVDARGKTTQISYPDWSSATTRKFDYDGNGNRISFTNGRNQKTVYGYDALNRLTAVDYPTTTPNRDVAYTYYPDGRRSTMVDDTGTTTYHYDSAERLDWVSQPLTGKTVSYTYLPASDRRETLSVGSQTWTNVYNTGLQLVRVEQTVGQPTAAKILYHGDGVTEEARDG